MAPRHQVQFFRQMALLLSSGFLLPDALARLEERYPDRAARRILREVHARVADARTTFSRALALFPRSFGPGTVAVVAAGEEAGAARLAERLADLADRIEYAQANQRQVRQACAYPVFALLMASGLYVLLLAEVFPRLAALLASLGGTLPPLTRGVIAVAAAVRAGWPVAVALLAAGAGSVAALRRSPRAALVLDRAFLRLPFAGPTYRDLTAALLCKVCRQLYQANQPAPEIIDLCAQLTANAAIRQRLREARRRIASGSSSLAAAFARSGLFPPLACLTLEVGEESGQLAPALERAADYLDRLARERIRLAIAVLNPALTLGIVSGVGVMIVSFFQAIYQVVYAAH
jgi:general secretion pathway protein F